MQPNHSQDRLLGILTKKTQQLESNTKKIMYSLAMRRKSRLDDAKVSLTRCNHSSMALAIMLAQAVDAREAPRALGAGVRLDSGVLGRMRDESMCIRKHSAASMARETMG